MLATCFTELKLSPKGKLAKEGHFINCYARCTMLIAILTYLFVMVESISALLVHGLYLAILAFGAIVTAYATCSINTPYNRSFSDTWNDGDLYKNWVKGCKRIIIIGVILGVTGKLLPDQKGLAIIIGSTAAYTVLTSEPAVRVGSKALQILEQKIDAALEGIDDEEEKGKAEQKPQPGSKSTPKSVST